MLTCKFICMLILPSEAEQDAKVIVAIDNNQGERKGE